jgi:hypothetical protein
MRYLICFLLTCACITSNSQSLVSFNDILAVNVNTDSIFVDYEISIINNDSVEYSFYHNYKKSSFAKGFVSFEKNETLKSKGFEISASAFSYPTTCKEIRIGPKSCLTINFKLNSGLMLIDEQYKLKKSWRKGKYDFKVYGIYLFKTEDFPLDSAKSYITPFKGFTSSKIPTKSISVGGIYNLSFIKKGKRIIPYIVKQ